MKTVYILQGGEVRVIGAALGAVATYEWNVPTGKKWLVYSISVERDVNTTLDIELEDQDGNAYIEFTQIAAAATFVMFPRDLQTTEYELWPPLLGSNFRVELNWGAPQTTPTVRINVLEM